VRQATVRPGVKFLLRGGQFLLAVMPSEREAERLVDEWGRGERRGIVGIKDFPVPGAGGWAVDLAEVQCMHTVAVEQAPPAGDALALGQAPNGSGYRAPGRGF